jgi:hypothetical protein
MWSRRTKRYTRCRLHGGASTGPKTPEGLEKCRLANWKHGRRSAAAIAEHRTLLFRLRMLRLDRIQLKKDVDAWFRSQRRALAQ